MKASVWTRKLHRHGSILIAAPLLVVLVSGLLLQLKKDWSWVQPPTQRGAVAEVNLPWPQILEATRAVAEAEVATWADIDRLDVRPERGLIKVRCANGWEVQLDGTTGSVLSSKKRRSDWLESLHDGSWFHPAAKLWVFLPAGLILTGLWFTGLYLWWLPVSVRRKRRRGNT